MLKHAVKVSTLLLFTSVCSERGYTALTLIIYCCQNCLFVNNKKIIVVRKGMVIIISVSLKVNCSFMNIQS